MSAGSVSGVIWILLNSPPMVWAKDFARVVLPDPGFPSSNTCPWLRSETSITLIMFSRPIMLFEISSTNRLLRLRSMLFLSLLAHILLDICALFSIHAFMISSEMWSIDRSILSSTILTGLSSVLATTQDTIDATAVPRHSLKCGKL